MKRKFLIKKANFLSLVRNINESLDNKLTGEDIRLFFNIALVKLFGNDHFKKEVLSYAEPIMKVFPTIDNQAIRLISQTVFDKISLKLLNKLVLNQLQKYTDKDLRSIRLDERYIRNFLIDNCSATLMKELSKKEIELDPNELANNKDNKNDVIKVNTLPIDFPSIRTHPLLIFDNYVFTGSKNDQHTDILEKLRHEPSQFKDYNKDGKNLHEEFGIKNMGLGSSFGNTVLLEYISDGSKEKLLDGNIMSNNGNLQQVISALKNAGYEKIYLQNKSPFSSKNYKREAKRKRTL